MTELNRQIETLKKRKEALFQELNTVDSELMNIDKIKVAINCGYKKVYIIDWAVNGLPADWYEVVFPEMFEKEGLFSFKVNNDVISFAPYMIKDNIEYKGDSIQIGITDYWKNYYTF